MRRKIFWLLLIVTIIMGVCGCSTDKGENISTESTVENETGSIQSDALGSVGENGQNETSLPMETQDESEMEEPRTGKAVVDIPESFKEFIAPSGIYVSTGYPTDGSNIYIYTSPLYGTFPDAKTYVAKINSSLTSQLGQKIDISLEEYGTFEMDGCEALKVIYSYWFNGTYYRRMEYMVNTDITTTIAYTQVNNAQWWLMFEESALSMRIE